VPQKRIRVITKGSAPFAVTEPLDAQEADRLLREEVVPKIGSDRAVSLPGLVINGKEIVSAQAFVPRRARLSGRAPSGRWARAER